MKLNGSPLSLEEIAAVAHGHELVQIAASVRPRILASRKVVDDRNRRAPTESHSQPRLRNRSATIGAGSSRDDVAARKRPHAWIQRRSPGSY